MEDFAAAFPGADVRPDRYVIDGPVFTTGGASPTFDLMLHLIRTRLGMAVALDVASVFIYDQARAATDAQPLVSLGRLDGYDPRLAQRDPPDGSACRPAADDRGHRPARRRDRAHAGEDIFPQSIGETPGAYYLRLRLNAARRLVLDTRRADGRHRRPHRLFIGGGLFARLFARLRPAAGAHAARLTMPACAVGSSSRRERRAEASRALHAPRHDGVPVGAVERPSCFGSGIAISRSTIDADSFRRSSKAAIWASRSL